MTERDPDCIFCKIVAGELPCARVYEDERCLAFLDIAPLSTGHTLVIPKDHFVHLTDMPAETMAAVGAALPRVARAVVAATSADGFNLLQANGDCAGQEVPHVHLHVIPRVAGDGLGFRWRASSYGDGEMEELAERITAALD